MEKTKMRLLKNKVIANVTTIILIMAISATIALIPTANAHSPPWIVTSYPYIVAAPNPVGVGQTVAVVMWVDDALPDATVTNDIRRHDYSLAITSPDGQTQTQNWPVLSDSTSVQYYQFTPDQVGNYTLKFNYPKQIYTWTGEYQNDTFTAASKTITLTCLL